MAKERLVAEHARAARRAAGVGIPKHGDAPVCGGWGIPGAIQVSRFRGPIAAALLSLLLVSCYTTYSGIYWLDSPDHLTAARVEALGVGLEQVLAPYGFGLSAPIDGHQLLLYYSGVNPISPSLQKLSGSDARIDVFVVFVEKSVFFSEHATLSVGDYNNDYETEFMKSLRSRIEAYLAEKGLQNIKFQRQRELL